MKKLSILLLFIIAAVLGFYAFKTHVNPKKEQDLQPAKTITPVVPGEESINTEEDTFTDEELTMSSFVPLENDETLFNAYPVDFNKDGYDDQIIAVKKKSNTFIDVIVGLYNPLYAAYERTIILHTKIDQTQTFSFYVADITGTHTNTLVITGFDNKNRSIMKAYMPSRTSRNLKLECVLDLVADGTIFIQQIQQVNTYDLGQTDGASFPIWVYMSDPQAKEGSLDQLQIEYTWNKSQYSYTENRVTKITGKTITAQELRKIQDGTIVTFASFLDGVWKKTSSQDATLRYLSFDYNDKEIIFANDDSQEVYNWKSSTLRRNGILLYITNVSISNLTRRFDIALVSTDEISIKISDNVGMPIGADALWDGRYKKEAKPVAEHKGVISKNSIIEKIITDKNGSWKTESGYRFKASKTGFSATPVISNQAQELSQDKEVLEEIGAISELYANGENLLQLKSIKPNSIFNGTFRIIITSKDIENAITETATLIPVKVGTKRITLSQKQRLHFSRIIEK